MAVDARIAPRALRPLDRLLYLGKMGVIQALRALTCSLGRRRALQLGRLLGRALYAVAGRLRKKILLNLDIALGAETTAGLRQHIARDACAHFCANWADVCQSGGARLDATLNAVGITGRAHLDRALERGRGVIAVSAHMGAYPLLGPRLERDGYRFLMAVRDLESPSGSAMYASCRELIGLRAVPTVPEKRFIKTTLAMLRSNGIVGIISDENRRRGGVFVDFFGRSASTAPGPAALARRTGAAIVPMFIVRNPDDTQTIHIHEPVYCGRSGDEQSDIRTATAAFTQAIERQIRQDPAQWPWNNWRWRTQPFGRDAGAKIRKRNRLKRISRFFKRVRGRARFRKHPNG
jgi:KDO2-lipid IV(A) lauroyltransferase